MRYFNSSISLKKFFLSGVRLLGSLRVGSAATTHRAVSRPKVALFSNAAAIIFLVLINCLFYWKSLGLYFIQDDFFYLASTSDHTLHGFLQIFTPSSTGFYRPISNPLYFFLLQLLFGTNPFPYHLANLLIHIINSLAVGYLVYLLTTNRKAAFLSALLFTSRVGHVIAIYWICVTTQSITLMFFLLAFISYIRYQKNGHLGYLLASYGFFALCAFANMNGPTLAVIITAFDLLMRKQNPMRTILKQESGFYAIVLLYLFLQFVVIGYRTQSNEYQVALGVQSLRNFGALNIFLYNFLFLFDHYLLYPETKVAFGFVMGAATIIMAVALAWHDKKSGQTTQSRLFLLFGFWYLWGLLPYLVIPGHLWLGEYVWPQYITTSAVGLAFLLAWLMIRLLPQKALIVAVSLLLLISFETVRVFEDVEYQTKGTIYKSELARNVIGDLTGYLKQQPKTKNIFILNSDVELWWILHYGRNLQVFTGTFRPIFHFTSSPALTAGANTLVVKFEGMHLLKVGDTGQVN
jgi:hypothetical protein